MTGLLHISSDFPDPLVPDKTAAVSGLISLADGIEHHVYSLNRVGPRQGIAALSFSDGHRAVAYGAPPYGIAHRSCLDRVARWIADDLAARRVQPQAIHAHKLTIEGIIGLRLARHLGVPLIVTCQGNTDEKILTAKPDLRGVFRDIWQSAAWVFALAPWTVDSVSECLGPRTGPITCLPCPTEADRIMVPRRVGPVVRSAFGLGAYSNKNAALVIEAAAIAADRVPGLTLEILGGGPPAAFAALAKMIEPHANVAQLAGPVAHGTVQYLLNRSACLVVPSRRESYGMVFAEALLAGCPVIHGQGNGISGYFPGTEFAREARTGATALADQIVDLIAREATVKACLAQAQNSGNLDRLRRPAIRNSYLNGLAGAAALLPYPAEPEPIERPAAATARTLETAG